MNYLLQLLVPIDIYVVLALSLNLLVGYVGLVSLCQGAFYGIGAYASTIVMIQLGLGFVPAMLIGAVIAGVLSVTISVPSLRLRSDYFVLASLGLQMIAFAVLYNWTALTNGPFGISGIPRPTIAGEEVTDLGYYALFCTAMAALCTALMYLILVSPFGRLLKAVREDELAAASLGKNVFRLKITAFALSAVFSAVAGAMYASYVRYIDPTSFSLTESIFILSIVIIGGAGNILGPVIGAVLMVLLPEALRVASIPDAIAPNVRQMIYGLLIILLMRFRPNGISGEYKFQ